MDKKIEAIILSIMCFILTIAICIQINTVKNNGSTVSGTQEQNNLKSQVLKMKEKYENEYAALQRAEQELEKERQNATKNNSELEDLESQIKKANFVLGNTDVTGSGIIVTLAAISINGERIVNTSAISCDGNVIVVNGKKVNSPIQIFAIGYVELLSALNRPGSTLDILTGNGKTADLKKISNSGLEIKKYTGVISFKYARAVK